MDYFKDCKTKEECTKKYHEWAKKLHPDVGGNKEDMVDLINQYDKWLPPQANRFERSSTLSEAEKDDMFRQGQEEYQKQYGGYGGYRFNTVNDIKSEYFRQRNDPRLADYERMKRDYEFMKKNYDPLHAKNVKQYFKILDLIKENNELKKKLERLKKKFKQPPKSKKDGKISASICL